MRAETRPASVADHLIGEIDRALRTIAAANVPSRPYPPGAAPDPLTDPGARRHAAGLMRVNHAGEIAAQALYQGQALTARNPDLRAALRDAAREETDHLAWCEQRLQELGDRTSLLAPVWYAGSFAIGALAGLAGDRVSLGFLAETERQVVDHLESHLRLLPDSDARSRQVVTQMQDDEARHGANALAAGGGELPGAIRTMMSLVAQVMTRTAYHV